MCVCVFVKENGGLTEQADDAELYTKLSSAVTGETMTFPAQGGECEFTVELRRGWSANAC